MEEKNIQLDSESVKPLIPGSESNKPKWYRDLKLSAIIFGILVVLVIMILAIVFLLKDPKNIANHVSEVELIIKKAKESSIGFERLGYDCIDILKDRLNKQISM